MENTAERAASPVETEVRRIRALFDRQHFAAALEAAERLAAEVPENRDVLYLVAVNQRYLGRLDDALATLERLQRFHPRYSRAYQEEGNCHVARKEAAQAITAFLAGVNINPALPRSWALLEGLYRMTGDAGNARTAAAHVATLERLAPEVVAATGLFSDGDLIPAESLVRAYLLKHARRRRGDAVAGPDRDRAGRAR